MQKIILVNYNTKWPDFFKEEKKALMSSIGSFVEHIEHIGSTSIPGISAKPVIDIMIGVNSLAKADAQCVELIRRMGYRHVRQYEREFPFRRYFTKNSLQTGRRTHQIHLLESTHPWFTRHLLFRDYLRAHPDDRVAYEQLKQQLSRRFTDTNNYAIAKTEFVKAIEAKALIWHNQKSKQ